MCLFKIKTNTSTLLFWVQTHPLSAVACSMIGAPEILHCIMAQAVETTGMVCETSTPTNKSTHFID